MNNRARKPPQTVHYHVDREHPLLQQTHRFQHNQTATLTLRVSLQIIYKFIHSNRMWYSSNSHCCPNPNFQILMLSQHIHSLHILMLPHKHQPVDNIHLLECKLIRCLSIPLQLLRPLCPTLQNRKYQNQSMEESRIAGNKLPHPQLMHKKVDSASDVNSWVT